MGRDPGKRARDADDDPITEAEIDEALKETFPASDPSAWTLGCTREQERRVGDRT